MRHDVVAGRYRLEECLSTTTMADVWRARDTVLERPVVVKLLAPDADRARFEREARAVAALAHPNIVQVFDYGEHGGRQFMVLECLPGGTLDERLPEAAALSDAETRRVATDVAAALSHAHEHGVIHRDLKPANVLFDAEGRAKVTDFGIAHVVGIDTLTDEGTVLGTAAYMSPEQVDGRAATPATDVYAFGVLLYRLLSGRYPFESENALELAQMQRDLEPPPIRTFRPDPPGDLAALVTAALAKDQNARPPDGAALLSALESDRTGVPPPDAATMVLPSPRGRGRQVRRRLFFAFGALLVLAAGLIAAVFAVGMRSSSAPPVSTRVHHAAHRHRKQPAATPVESVPSTATTRPTTSYKAPPPPPPPPSAATTMSSTSTTTTAPTTTAPTTTPPTTTGG